ncbi:MAG: hypothetical protein ACK5JI_06390 [Azonexus sp.]
MKTPGVLLATLLALSLGGCSSGGSNAFSLALNTSVKANVLIPAALAIYVIYDPLAPNWEIEESRLSDDSYHLSMKMKRYHTGGAGEAIQVFKRRAQQLQREQGLGEYQILGYSEGIDSQTLSTRRVAEGTIRFARPVADSFALNATPINR